jgi:hypothetical protein
VVQHHQGRRVMWADGEATRVGRTAAQLEADLLLAIDRNEIEVLFQPQFALYCGDGGADGLTGAEALARWKHPKLGRIGRGPVRHCRAGRSYGSPLASHCRAGIESRRRMARRCVSHSMSRRRICRRAAFPSIWAARLARPAFPATA